MGDGPLLYAGNSAGVIKVEKLRAILLMEADFNFFNGLMYAG
jgi:hypothetical protein